MILKSRPNMIMNASFRSVIGFVLLAVLGTAAVAADPCSEVECQHGGTCEAYGQSFLCVCIYGYEGEFCQNAIVLTTCDGVNCNHGTCQEENGVARCDCQFLTTGVFCENDLCLHINCGVSPSGPIDCFPGYSGDNSDPVSCGCPGTDTNPISRFCHPGIGCGIGDSSCNFNGQCENSDPFFTLGSEFCICNDGFFGDFCEYGPCSDDMCQNGGSCRYSGGFRGCDCRDGFEGDSCEIVKCFGNSCENGGTCVVEGEMFTCNCAEGFGGDLCETDLSECFGVSCLNNGTCIGTSDADAECICKEGISGDRCQFGNCFNQPATFCQNGGSCIGDSLDELRCFCPEGFSGVLCEIGPCPDYVVCKNGARCAFVNRDVNRCFCARGFIGPTCEIIRE